MTCLILPLYLVGAVIFWSSHKSESLKLDFFMGLAWPVIVPVEVVMSFSRRLRASLEEQKLERAKALADREAELRAREEFFIGYGGEGIAKWIVEEVGEEKDDKEVRETQNVTRNPI